DRTDGTPAGTHRVDESVYRSDGKIIATANHLFFSGGTQAFGGLRDLWSIRSNGTAALFKKLNNARAHSVLPEKIGVAYNGKFYYSARIFDLFWQNRVGVTDGTEAGSSYYRTDMYTQVLGAVNGRLLLRDWGNLYATETGV